MVTERSGDCSARRKQARLTNASDASSWPTPRAGNPGSRKPGTGGKILAEEAKKNWGTPASNDANKTPHCEINSKQGGLSKSVGIEEAKKNWQTPSEGDAARRGSAEAWKQYEEENRTTQCRLRNQIHAGPPAPEKSSTSGKNQERLNPAWVEQLMGLEVGWTQLPTEWTDCASSEMAFCQPVQK